MRPDEPFSSRSLIDVGFASFGVQRVVAHTMTVNRASRRVMDKLGLTDVRTFRLDWPDIIVGTEEGDVEYGVDRSELDGRVRRVGWSTSSLM